MSNLHFQWESPDGTATVFPISQPEIVIGRKDDADLVLSGLNVSRHHAKVTLTPEGYVVEDLGSTCGTFVNDERITRRVLCVGDKVAFGTQTLEFRRGPEANGRSPESDATQTVQQSFENLSRVLPSAISDLEKIQCLLDFQFQWNQVFTPENCLTQILESVVRISGAERAFIMTRQSSGFSYAAGLDGRKRRLSESEFRTSRSVVQEVVATGRPVFMVEGLEKFAVEASIMAMNLLAVACLPLRGIPADSDQPEILGILYLDSTRAMHSLSGLDERILTKLALEAGNVLERVETLKTIEKRKLLERDLALAEETQKSLLPRDIPQLDYLRLHAFSKPTRYVGGDFYHFSVSKDGSFTGLLADVSGKGVSASLLSSMFLGCIDMLLNSGQSPAAVLNQLNRFFCRKSTDRFVTIFLFSTGADGSGDYISAGHNTAYLYRAATKEIEELPSTGLLLGVFGFASYEPSPFHLNVGDILLVYSDGLTEAENSSGEQFGEERLQELILREAPSGTDHLETALLASIQEFTAGHAQTDDITIMIAERI